MNRRDQDILLSALEYLLLVLEQEKAAPVMEPKEKRTCCKRLPRFPERRAFPSTEERRLARSA